MLTDAAHPPASQTPVVLVRLGWSWTPIMTTQAVAITAPKPGPLVCSLHESSIKPTLCHPAIKRAASLFLLNAALAETKPRNAWSKPVHLWVPYLIEWPGEEGLGSE